MYLGTNENLCYIHSYWETAAMSTWMVVEDEPDLYDTLLALFEIWSIDGVAFTNGTDAVKWIADMDSGSAETNIPELAILDIRLVDDDDERDHRGTSSPAALDALVNLASKRHVAIGDAARVMRRECNPDTVVHVVELWVVALKNSICRYC